MIRDPNFAAFRQLIHDTPALREYSRAMWLRYEGALARAVAEQTGRPADDLLCAALARFTLETMAFAGTYPDRFLEAIDQAFGLLGQGWTALTT